MKNKKITAIVYFFFYLTLLNSQPIYKYDNACSFENSIIMAEVLIHTIGKEKVEKILNDKRKVFFRGSFDNNGYFIKFNSIINEKREPYFSLTFGNIIDNYIHKKESLPNEKKPLFFICLIDDSSLEIYSQNKSSYNLDIGFPGMLSLFISRDYEKALRQNKKKSKYDILLEIIRKYKKNDLMPVYDYKSIFSEKD